VAGVDPVDDAGVLGGVVGQGGVLGDRLGEGVQGAGNDCEREGVRGGREGGREGGSEGRKSVITTRIEGMGREGGRDGWGGRGARIEPFCTSSKMTTAWP
jgi:hypothetical protein